MIPKNKRSAAMTFSQSRGADWVVVAIVANDFELFEEEFKNIIKGIMSAVFDGKYEETQYWENERLKACKSKLRFGEEKREFSTQGYLHSLLDKFKEKKQRTISND